MRAGSTTWNAAEGLWPGHCSLTRSACELEHYYSGWEGFSPAGWRANAFTGGNFWSRLRRLTMRHVAHRCDLLLDWLRL